MHNEHHARRDRMALQRIRIPADKKVAFMFKRTTLIKTISWSILATLAMILTLSLIGWLITLFLGEEAQQEIDVPLEQELELVTDD